MATIHWLGAGLSSVPGIRRLATNGRNLVLWNRTLAKAEQALDGLGDSAQAQQLDWPDLTSQIENGDVVVSMLPATMHVKVANICLEQKAHFVSSSYVSPAMKELNQQASDSGLCFLNEVGLDPGLDHLLAHVLMDEYKSSPVFNAENEHSFRSYCGGFPKVANDFKYKFSWSPLGVLKALRSPAKWIANGQEQSTDKPWKSVQRYDANLPGGVETFQAYPNRDSLPFMGEYGFGENWNMKEFVRGTLRLNGWTDAWSDIFDLVENASGEQGEKAISDKSDELWSNFRYDDGESDRVVLTVDLEVENGGETVWRQVYCLDEAGNEKGSAMARLVSLTVSVAIESVLDGKVDTGVSAATTDVNQAKNWLGQMIEFGETFELKKIV